MLSLPIFFCKQVAFLCKQIIFSGKAVSKQGTLSGCLVVFLLCANSQATELPTSDNSPSSYLISYTTTSPTIDGVLNEPIWSQAKHTQHFVIHDSGRTAPVNTFAQLTWDNHYLYLAVTCEDKDIYAHYTKHQSPLFRRDDLVEIFIDPDGDGKNYIEIGFSANNIHYSLIVPEVIDGKIEPELLDIPDLHYTTHIHGTLNNSIDQDLYWTLEARIPLNALNSHKPTQKNTWRLGLFRIDYHSHSKTNQADGYYAWQYLGQFGFHRPDRFGFVTFENIEKP